MSNRKFTTARAAAFWLGLVLHFGLGTALYYHVSAPNAIHSGRTERVLQAIIPAAKP